MKSMNSLAERYLALLKKSLLNVLYLEGEARIAYFVEHALRGTFPPITQAIDDFLRIKDSDKYLELKEARKYGNWLPYGGAGNLRQPDEVAARNFLFTAHTMIGEARLDNIHECLDTIVRDDIPGDLIETGVWKGGATIFMRGFLAAHNLQNRVVWVADSFEGLPPPSHERDQGWNLSKEVFQYLCVSMEEVQELFARYDLLDDRVRFIKGWFSDSLPKAPVERLALLRLDGDLYESTMDALNNLYPKLSPGGFVIVDDYNALPQCKEAVHDFRGRHLVEDEILPIDQDSVYWRKAGNDFPGPSDASPSVRDLLKLLFRIRN